MSLKINHTIPSAATKWLITDVTAAAITADLADTSAMHYVVELTSSGRMVTLPTPSADFLGSEVTVTCKTPGAGNVTLSASPATKLHSLDNNTTGLYTLSDRDVVTARCHEYSAGNFLWEWYFSNQSGGSTPNIPRMVSHNAGTNKVIESTSNSSGSYDIWLLADSGTAALPLTEYNTPELTTVTRTVTTDNHAMSWTNSTTARLYRYDISLVIETTDAAFDIEGAFLELDKQAVIIDRHLVAATGGSYDRVYLKLNGVVALGNSDGLKLKFGIKGSPAGLRIDYGSIALTEVSTS